LFEVYEEDMGICLVLDLQLMEEIGGPGVRSLWGVGKSVKSEIGVVNVKSVRV
jgi:hypothetical protein